MEHSKKTYSVLVYVSIYLCIQLNLHTVFCYLQILLVIFKKYYTKNKFNDFYYYNESLHSIVC